MGRYQLRPAESWFLMHLMLMMDQKKSDAITVSFKDLAEATNMCQRSIDRTVRILINKDVIQCEEGFSPRNRIQQIIPNTYRVIKWEPQKPLSKSKSV